MAEQTEVISVEKVRSRYKVLLDNGDSYWLTKGLFAERPLNPGELLDPEEFAGWVTLHQYRSALDKAVAMLAQRPCSTGEISRKLKNTGYAPDTVDMVLYKLEKHELTDDRAFAEQWAQYRSGQKYGPHRIARELKQKGLSSEDTENALSALSGEDQLEQATVLARKAFARAKAGEDPRKTLQKVLAAIVRRGYSWDIAREACEEYVRQAEEAEDSFPGEEFPPEDPV